MQCPIHKLFLDYDNDRLGYKCVWHGCDHFEPDTERISPELSKQFTPQFNIQELLNMIKFDVKRVGDRITVTAHLPRGFTMSTYNRIFHLHNARDYDMTDAEYIDWQKAELFQDLLVRIKTEKVYIA